MKTTTLKVVLVTLILALGVACGKRSANSLTVTKAGVGAGTMDWSDMFYLDTPTSETGGEYRYIISGTAEKPLVFLKALGTDKKVFYGVTLALRRSDGKALKANNYQLIYDEYITCGDGPTKQGGSYQGTYQIRITHAPSTDTWKAVKGVISLVGTGSISRDPAPPPTMDPTTKRVTKYPRPKSGKMSISANVGEPEVQKASLNLQVGLHPYDYTKIIDDGMPTMKKADAIALMDQKGVCKGVKATSTDIVTPAPASPVVPSAPATAHDLQEDN